MLWTHKRTKHHFRPLKTLWKPLKRNKLSVEAVDESSAPTRIMRPGARPLRRKVLRKGAERFEQVYYSLI